MNLKLVLYGLVLLGAVILLIIQPSVAGAAVPAGMAMVFGATIALKTNPTAPKRPLQWVSWVGFLLSMFSMGYILYIEFTQPLR